jgi:hypothetical protein
MIFTRILPWFLAFGAIAWTGATVLRQPADTLPLLWAWERPEDLSFIGANEAGVALLASTMRLSGELVLVQPRLQSITLPIEQNARSVRRYYLAQSHHRSTADATQYTLMHAAHDALPHAPIYFQSVPVKIEVGVYRVGGRRLSRTASSPTPWLTECRRDHTLRSIHDPHRRRFF